MLDFEHILDVSHAKQEARATFGSGSGFFGFPAARDQGNVHCCASLVSDAAVRQDVAQLDQLLDDRIGVRLGAELARIERDLGVQGSLVGIINAGEPLISPARALA